MKASEPHAWIMLRHAERNRDIISDSPWTDPITPEGILTAQNFGKDLRVKGFSIAVMLSSPLQRCVQTAERILEGSCSDLDVEMSNLLGDPGPFVMGDIDLQLFSTMSARDLVKLQIAGQRIKGIRDISEGTRMVLRTIVGTKCSGTSIGIFVSHDAIIAPVLYHLTGILFGEDRWIDFMDGFCILRDGDDWSDLSW